MNYFGKNLSLLLEDFGYWENKNNYLDLMERFIHGKIDGTQFDIELSQMWGRDRDKKYSLKKSLIK